VQLGSEILPAVEQRTYCTGEREIRIGKFRTLPGQELTQDQAERIDIGGLTDLAPFLGVNEGFKLLRRGVRQRSAPQGRLGLEHRVRIVGEVEIEKLGALAEREQDVRGLDVAVLDPL